MRNRWASTVPTRGSRTCTVVRSPASPAAAPTTPAAPKAPATAPATAPALQPIAGVLPVAGDFTIKDFTFASGEKLPELRIHYMTLGTLKRDASGHAANAVLIMHG